METLQRRQEAPSTRTRRSEATRAAAWPPASGSTSAARPACRSTVNEDGTVTLMVGTPDIGGSRASLAAMAAEELGIPYDKVRPIIADTGSLGFNFLTGGSRSTFSGLAWPSSRRAQAHQGRALRARRARCGRSRRTQVELEDGSRQARWARNAGKFKPLSLADIAKMAGKTGGPIAGTRAHQCPGRRAQLRHAPGRRRGRSGDRPHAPSCATPWSRTPARPIHPATSRASSRAAPCRASAGRSTRSTSTARTASCRTRASSTTACPSPPTCR